MNLIPMRDIFGQFLADYGKKIKELVVLDVDLSSSTRTILFSKSFPDRFFNFGIAEQNMLGAAIGFAISGKIPVVSGFSIFTTGRAWDFIRLACHDNLNLKLIPTHAGFVGEDGSTHNALEDLSLMASLTNLNVLVPCDNIELKQILQHALSTSGPFYIRLPREGFPSIHEESYKFILGKPDILKDGKDICFIGTGYGSNLAYNSVSLIEEQLNISIKVINLPSIKPIDEESLIKEIENIKGLIVIEEHNVYCGFGSIIARIVAENSPKPIVFLGVYNSFGQSGKRESLLDCYGLNLENLLELTKQIIQKL